MVIVPECQFFPADTVLHLLCDVRFVVRVDLFCLFWNHSVHTLSRFGSPEKVYQSVHRKQPFSVSRLSSVHALMDLTRGLLLLGCLVYRHQVYGVVVRVRQGWFSNGCVCMFTLP